MIATATPTARAKRRNTASRRTACAMSNGAMLLGKRSGDSGGRMGDGGSWWIVGYAARRFWTETSDVPAGGVANCGARAVGAARSACAAWG